MVDACTGFYAIKMEENAKKYISFVTPRITIISMYCYASPVSWMYLVYMQNWPTNYYFGLNDVDTSVNNLIAYSNDADQHINILKDLFERIRKANFKLKPFKVRIGYIKLTFLRQIVGNGTVRPTQDNMEKILIAPIPKKGVRSLCGTVNLLCKFILKSLTELTSKRHRTQLNGLLNNRKYGTKLIRC